MKGWFRRRSHPGQGAEIETTIGPSTTLVGALEVDGGLRIDGRFEGRLEVGGNVVIGEEGRVIADIDAGHVTVGGAVQGNIRATGRLEILSTGIVRGDILAQQVMIAPGGVLQGMSLMGEAAAPALNAPKDEAPAGRAGSDESEHASTRAGSAEEVVGKGESQDDDTPKTQGPRRAGQKGTGFAKPKSGGDEVQAAQNDEDEDRAAPRAQGKARGERRAGLGRGLDLKALDIEAVIPDLSPSKAESKGDA